MIIWLVACGPALDISPEEYAWLARLRRDAPPATCEDTLPPLSCGDYAPAMAPSERRGDPGVVRLGADLFVETRLSGPFKVSDPAFAGRNGEPSEMSCNSCHAIAVGGADPRGAPTSFGAEGWTPRNTPSVWDAVDRHFYSWAPACEQMWGQIRLPLTRGFHGIRNDPSCAGPSGEVDACVLRVVEEGYASAFADAFGHAPAAETVVDDVAQALDAYVATLRTEGAPFDRWLGADYAEHVEVVDADRASGRETMSPAAIRGARWFVGKGTCDQCHYGPLLSDGCVHDLGVDPTDPQPFQTPSLRNVALSPPYFHDGSAATLDEVLWFYAEGSAASRDPELPPHGLDLDEDERRDLVAFLGALTGSLPAGVTIPGAP